MKAFECKMCGTCCKGKGGIVVQDDEIEKIAYFLGLSQESFRMDCCEEKKGKSYYIKTGQDGFCLFYDKEQGCIIHPVKPKVCSLWPFYTANIKDEYSWNLAKGACPGINPKSTFEEFVKQSKE